MAFIFIGRRGRTPFKSDYKRTLQTKSNLIWITQDQTDLTGRPSTLLILAANTMALAMAANQNDLCSSLSDFSGSKFAQEFQDTFALLFFF